MDAFFKWCAACATTYGDVQYANQERVRLGQIHQQMPAWTLAEVVDWYQNHG